MTNSHGGVYVGVCNILKLLAYSQIFLYVVHFLMSEIDENFQRRNVGLCTAVNIYMVVYSYV